MHPGWQVHEKVVDELYGGRCRVQHVEVVKHHDSLVGQLLQSLLDRAPEHGVAGGPAQEFQAAPDPPARVGEGSRVAL